MYKSIILFFLLFISFLHCSNLELLKMTQIESDKFKINYLYDKDKKSFDEIKKTKFKSSTKNNFTLGYKKGSLWLNFKIINDTQTEDFILSIGESFYETANIYHMYKNKWIKKTNGVFNPINNREIKYNKLSFPLKLEKNKPSEIFIKLKGKYSYFGNIQIFQENNFIYTHVLNSNLIYIFILGISLLVFLFSFVLFLSLREKIYFYYTAYTFFTLIYVTNISGLLVYVDLQSYMYILHSSVAFSLASLAMFSFEYLNIQNYFKRYYKVLYLVPAIFILLGIALLFEYQPWNKYINNFGFLFCIFMLVLSAYFYIKSFTKSKYYFCAIFTYFIMAVYFTLMNTGIVEYNLFSRHALIIGTTLENILFMLMIATRYKELKDENEKRLEQQIKNRTKSLEKMAKEKELLLKELFHRVKNNFHIIIGMLWIEGKKNENITPLINRVESMSILNELLYKSKELQDIQLKKYLDDILNNITSSYKDVCITWEYDLNIAIKIDNIIDIGMLLNEVVTNSIKHNKEIKLNINIILKNTKNNIYLSVKDNGKGFDMETQTKGLGMKMIKNFCKRLNNASYKYDFESGTKFSLEYKEI